MAMRFGSGEAAETRAGRKWQMLPAAPYDRSYDFGRPGHPTDAELPKLVHIIGYPSSGTTLLRRILNAHPELCITSEMPLLPMLVGKLPARVNRTNFRETKRRLLAVDIYGNFHNRELLFSDLAEQFGPAEHYAAAHLYAALIDRRSCTYYGNKTPQYSESLPKLLALFPHTKLILIVRDIRDVALSFRARWGKSEILCAHKWHRRMDMALTTLAQLPAGQSYLVRYEDLIGESQKTVAGIYDFLGIRDVHQFDHRTHGRGRGFDADSRHAVEFDHTRIGRWRKSLPQATTRRVEETSYDTLKRFEYVPQFAKGAESLSKLKRLFLEFRDFVAAFSPHNQHKSLTKFSGRVGFIFITLKRRWYVR
jgi:hypothetical protein